VVVARPLVHVGRSGSGARSRSKVVSGVSHPQRTNTGAHGPGPLSTSWWWNRSVPASIRSAPGQRSHKEPGW